MHRNSRGRGWGPAAAYAAAVILAAAGCGRGAAGVDAAGDSHYPLKGEILAVDSARHVATVNHAAIDGLMPAMAMEYAISAGDAGALRVGEHIRADLVKDPAGHFRLAQIWPDDAADAAAITAGARALREDTHDRGESAYREVGETMPNFTLYDQDGRVVSSARFRGKQILLNFIFTRCPNADMCPASTAKMSVAQRLAREAGIKNIELISITLDPTFDTPGVLKEYASERGIDLRNFSFLTGPESAVRDILTQFGVIDDFAGELTKHTLATLLIAPDGKIIWRDDTSRWDPEEFVRRMHRT
jgi:protein SCO1/2